MPEPTWLHTRESPHHPSTPFRLTQTPTNPLPRHALTPFRLTPTELQPLLLYRFLTLRPGPVPCDHHTPCTPIIQPIIRPDTAHTNTHLPSFETVTWCCNPEWPSTLNPRLLVISVPQRPLLQTLLPTGKHCSPTTHACAHEALPRLHVHVMRNLRRETYAHIQLSAPPTHVHTPPEALPLHTPPAPETQTPTNGQLPRKNDPFASRCHSTSHFINESFMHCTHLPDSHRFRPLG